MIIAICSHLFCNLHNDNKFPIELPFLLIYRNISKKSLNFSIFKFNIFKLQIAEGCVKGSAKSNTPLILNAYAQGI